MFEARIKYSSRDRNFLCEYMCMISYHHDTEFGVFLSPYAIMTSDNIIKYIIFI